MAKRVRYYRPQRLLSRLTCDEAFKAENKRASRLMPFFGDLALLAPLAMVLGVVVQNYALPDVAPVLCAVMFLVGGVSACAYAYFEEIQEATTALSVSPSHLSQASRLLETLPAARAIKGAALALNRQLYVADLHRMEDSAEGAAPMRLGTTLKRSSTELQHLIHS